VRQKEQPAHITWHPTPPTPAQLTAWDRLWTRLLEPPGPETTTAPGTAAPGAVTNNDTSFADQASDQLALHHPPNEECCHDE
jgi:hypothetical protein